MNETVEAVVLKTSDYQEKSKILQVFSKEHGLIGIFLRGANDYKNMSYPLAQPLTHASLAINYHDGLSGCFRGDVLGGYGSLKLDFERNIYIFHLFELILKNLDEHRPYPYLYELLLIIMKQAEGDADKNQLRLLINFFEMKLLAYSGISPELSQCVECGSTQNIVNFDISRGGFVCAHHNDFHSRQFSIETLKNLYELFLAVNSEALKIPAENSLKELRILFNEYYQYHLGFKTNSSKYLT